MLNAEIIETLKTELPFWNNLTQPEKESLVTNSKIVKYRKGENIHSPDNECVGVLLIQTGELRTYILSEGGKEITLYRLHDNDFCILSASCLLNNISFDVFIDAEKDTEVLLIPSVYFFTLQSENLYVENFALHLTADRFSDVMWAMEQILFTSFDVRLATFLLDETSKNKSDNLTLTHEQIAKYLGSAREVVSRMLKYFESENIIELHRGGLSIVDRIALTRKVNL